MDEYEFVPDRGLLLLQMVQAVPVAKPAFFDSEWHLFKFPKPVLQTSDEPIHLGRNHSPVNEFLGLGPMNADQLGLPISPHLYLGMFATESLGPERIHRLPNRLARSFNEATLSTWWTQFFQHAGGPSFPKDIPDLPDERIQVNSGGPTLES